LEQKQRLGQAAQVCRAWRAAAVAATTEVSFNLSATYGSMSRSYKLHSFSQWLAA
jgi:hypothetical protein